MTSSDSLAAKRTRLEVRARIEQSVRSFFESRGFLEVYTPIRTPSVIPEEHIDAFQSEGWYLSTSPELYMKRLLCAGYERIYQIAPCFRKGEQGTYHLPEFTMLEWYRSEADYRDLETDCEELICFVATKLEQFPHIYHRDSVIKLSGPWKRVSLREAFMHYAGWDPVGCADTGAFELDLVEKVIPNLDPSLPVFLEDFPAACASLAACRSDDVRIAERVELFVAGLELANGFSELRDPQEQRMRFERVNAYRASTGKQPYPLPEAFLAELAHLPQAAGMALGLDRLVMLFTDAASIEDVVAFPCCLR